MERSLGVPFGVGRPGARGRFALVAALALAVGCALALMPAKARALAIDCNQSGIGCISQFGYTGASTWGYPVDGAGNNCTNYAAFRLARNGAANPGNLGDAYRWGPNAAAKGFAVNSTPAVGAIAWFNESHPWAPGTGHVAYVDAVSGGTLTLSDSNWQGGSKRWRVSAGERMYPTGFIHIRDAPPPGPPRGSPYGSVDAINGGKPGFVQVRGWTVDPDAPTASINIHVYIDGPAGTGTFLGAVKANVERPDVNRVHPGVGNAHGFAWAFGGVSPGAHRVYIYPINVSGTPGSNYLLGSDTITVAGAAAGSPYGHLDRVDGELGGKVRVRGWTVDPDAPTTPTNVHIYIDGPAGSGVRGVSIGAANSLRADVGRVHPGVGDNHGFDARIEGLSPGVHTIWAYAINRSGGGDNPLLEVLGVRVPVGDVPPPADPAPPDTPQPDPTLPDPDPTTLPDPDPTIQPDPTQPGTPTIGGGPVAVPPVGDPGVRPPPRPRLCRVPKLVGLTPLKARQALSRAGCRIGSVTFTGRKRRAPDRVIRASRKPGVQLAGGARVNVLVRR